MKRFSLIFLGVLAMLFVAGCSKDNPQASDENAWVHDLSLPVPIQFGSPALQTKATSFDSLDEFADHFILNPTDALGVFGVAKDVDLSSTDDLADSEVVLLDNMKATITVGTEGGYVVSLAETKYYPRLSTHNYTFYGCYPRMTGRTINEDGQLMVNVGNDPNSTVSLGTTDILWAKAEATPFDYNGETIDGYNAAYMRALRTSGNNQYSPKFQFEHVTAGLKFVAVGSDDGGNNTNEDFTGITINNVIVKNVHRSGKLNVMTGKMTDLAEPRNVTLSCGKNPTLEGTELCRFFPYPGDAGYDVVVNVTSTANPSGYEVTFNTGALEAGKQYIYKLKFNKMDAVEIQVTGLVWANGSEDLTVDTDAENPTPVSDNPTEDPGDDDSGSETTEPENP